MINKTFKNGLQLVYEQKKDTSISSLNIFVKVGSIDENEKLRGFTHFLEHMLFKGSNNYPSADIISEKFDITGSSFNAYTLHDHTVFILKCNSEYLEELLVIFLDMLNNSLINKNIENQDKDYIVNYNKEKQVVEDEIIMYIDQSQVHVNEKIYELLFPNTPLEYPIGGLPEQIRNYDYNEGSEYYKKYYIPNNMTISVCSNLDFKTIESYIPEEILSIKSKRPVIKDEFIVKSKGFKYGFKTRKSEQTYICIGFKTCSKFNKDKHVLDVLENMLVGNMSSILFREIREKNGLTYSISIDSSNYKNLGCFNILTSVDSEKFIMYKSEKNKVNKGLLPILIEILIKIKSNTEENNQFLQKHLDIAKNYLKGSISIQNEDSNNIASYNGYNFAFDLKEKNIKRADFFDKIYKNIKLKDIKKIIKKYITYDNMVAYMIGPELNNKELRCYIKSMFNQLNNIEYKNIDWKKNIYDSCYNYLSGGALKTDDTNDDHSTESKESLNDMIKKYINKTNTDLPYSIEDILKKVDIHDLEYILNKRNSKFYKVKNYLDYYEPKIIAEQEETEKEKLEKSKSTLEVIEKNQFIDHIKDRIIDNKYMDVMPKKVDILNLLDYANINLIEQEWNSREKTLQDIIRKKLNLD